MKQEKLRRSIFVIILLAVLIMLQHSVSFFWPDQLLLSLIIDACTIFVFVLYLIQLRDNFSRHLKIDTLRKNILIIIISYCGMILMSEIIRAYLLSKPAPDLRFWTIYIPLFFFSISAMILVIIQYIILGNKLIRYTGSIKTKYLAYSFYTVPVLFLLLLTFGMFKATQQFNHSLIILELLPYWFTFRIYNALLKTEPAYFKRLSKSDPLNKHISGQEQRDDMEYMEHLKYSPEMWAAKYGHLIGCGDLRNYTYEDKEFEKWVHELFRILHTEDLSLIRSKLLSPEEIIEIAKNIEGGF